MSGYPASALIEALTKAYEPTAQHEVLKQLVGEWDMSGDWHILEGEPPRPLSARVVNSSVFTGQLVESKSFLDNDEGSRAIYGYDPDVKEYYAFAVNSMSPRYDVETGVYDAEAKELRFTCVEHVGPQRIAVTFHRTLTFISPDRYDLVIVYPERKPEHQLGMHLKYQRVGS